MRNNDERTGAVQQSDSPAPSQKTGQLNFVLPTEFVQLPSKGKFYKEDHPLWNQQTLEIKQMTAKQEDILTSQSLLKQGVAIDRFVQSILVQDIDVDSILVGDKNAILIAARMSGYGDIYETGVTCPACGTVSEIPVSLGETRKMSDGYLEMEALEPLEGVSGPNKLGNFEITLPVSKAIFEVKIMNGKLEKEFSKRIQTRKKKKQSEAMLTDQFKVYTVSISGVTDLRQVYKFIDQIPVKDSRFLRNTYAKIVPTVDLKYDFFCTNCTHEQEVSVPITAQFFWPDA
tara:strand:+ start:1262 stop:2122 length:861 start_codon:yes stop_codon:yes gene_type:complete